MLLFNLLFKLIKGFWGNLIHVILEIFVDWAKPIFLRSLLILKTVELDGRNRSLLSWCLALLSLLRWIIVAIFGYRRRLEIFKCLFTLPIAVIFRRWGIFVWGVLTLIGNEIWRLNFDFLQFFYFSVLLGLTQLRLLWQETLDIQFFLLVWTTLSRRNGWDRIIVLLVLFWSWRLLNLYKIEFQILWFAQESFVGLYSHSLIVLFEGINSVPGSRSFRHFLQSRLP